MTVSADAPNVFDLEPASAAAALAGSKVLLGAIIHAQHESATVL